MEPAGLVSRHPIRFLCQGFRVKTSSAISSFTQCAPCSTRKDSLLQRRVYTNHMLWPWSLKGPCTMLQLKVVFTTYLIQQEEDYRQYFWKSNFSNGRSSGACWFPWTFSPSLPTHCQCYICKKHMICGNPSLRLPPSPSPKRSLRFWHAEAHLVQLHPSQTSKD